MPTHADELATVQHGDVDHVTLVWSELGVVNCLQTLGDRNKLVIVTVVQ